MLQLQQEGQELGGQAWSETLGVLQLLEQLVGAMLRKKFLYLMNLSLVLKCCPVSMDQDQGQLWCIQAASVAPIRLTSYHRPIFCGLALRHRRGRGLRDPNN